MQTENELNKNHEYYREYAEQDLGGHFVRAPNSDQYRNEVLNHNELAHNNTSKGITT